MAVWSLCLFFAVGSIRFCMSLSVYNKNSLTRELTSPCLLPSILAGSVLDHVLLLSGSCTVRNTRCHLGTIPSKHFYLLVLTHCQSSANAGGREASTDPFLLRLRFSGRWSAKLPSHYLFCLPRLPLITALEVVSCNQVMKWFIVGGKRERMYGEFHLSLQNTWQVKVRCSFILRKAKGPLWCHSLVLWK